MFSNNIRVIYLYLVALLTIGMIIGGTIAVITNAVDLVLPEKQEIYNYNRYDEYDDPILIEQEKEIREKNERIRKIKNVVYSVAVVVVAVPFYVYSWKKIEEEREMEG